MKQPRKHYEPPQKVAILKRHLFDRVPISDLCDEFGIHPTMFYKWQKTFFENGTAAFEKSDKRAGSVQARKLVALEQKVQQRNEVIAELMGEHVQLKKELGEL